MPNAAELPESEHQGKPRLVDQLHQLTRALHMSIRTEEAYVRWVEEFFRFYRNLAGRWRHPLEMGSVEVNQFLCSALITDSVRRCWIA